MFLQHANLSLEIPHHLIKFFILPLLYFKFITNSILNSYNVVSQVNICEFTSNFLVYFKILYFILVCLL